MDGSPRGGIAKALSDGVYRIRLEAVDGLVVNAYAIDTGGGFALIDAGFPSTVDQLERGLGALGAGIADVHTVVFTHTHTDHMGGAAALAARWSARHVAWEGTCVAFDDYYAFEEARGDGPEWPIPSLPPARRHDPRVLAIRDKPRVSARGPGDGRLPLEGIPHGGSVSLGGGWRLRCLDGRGHDPLHAGWIDDERGWLFCGDAVLALPTPFVRSMGDDPVAWLQTLRRWSREPLTRLLPGHGMPTTLVEPTFARSRAHFERLYDAVRARLASGSATDALAPVLDVLPVDRTRHARQTAILLATSECVLGLLGERAVAEEVGEGLWVGCGVAPTLRELEREAAL